VTWISAPIARLIIGVDGGSIIVSTPNSMVNIPWVDVVPVDDQRMDCSRVFRDVGATEAKLLMIPKLFMSS